MIWLIKAESLQSEEVGIPQHYFHETYFENNVRLRCYKIVLVYLQISLPFVLRVRIYLIVIGGFIYKVLF